MALNNSFAYAVSRFIDAIVERRKFLRFEYPFLSDQCFLCADVGQVTSIRTCRISAHNCKRVCVSQLTSNLRRQAVHKLTQSDIRLSENTAEDASPYRSLLPIGRDKRTRHQLGSCTLRVHYPGSLRADVPGVCEQGVIKPTYMIVASY